MCFFLLLTGYSFSFVNPVPNRCPKADYRCCYDKTVQRSQSQTSWSKLHHIQTPREPPPEYNDILLPCVQFSLFLRINELNILLNSFYNHLLTCCLPMLKVCEQYRSSKESAFPGVLQMYSLFFFQSSAEIITHGLLNLGKVYWFWSRNLYFTHLSRT